MKNKKPKPIIQYFPTSESMPDLVAKKVFVFYGGDHNYHITAHTVDEGVVQAGSWVDVQVLLNELDKAHRPNKRRAEQVRLPYHILFAGADTLVWHIPAEVRALTFTAPSMKALSGRLQAPGLIMRASRKSLEVFAVEDDRPTAESVLCEAPFPNVYSGGGLCLGTMPTYGTAFSDAERWTEAFFGSAFTHATYEKYWKDVSTGGSPKLKPAGKTLETLFS